MFLLLLASLSHADMVDPCWDSVMDVAPKPGSISVPMDAVLRAHNDANCSSSMQLELLGGDSPQLSVGVSGDADWTNFDDVQLQANTSYTALFSNEMGAEVTVEFTTTDQLSAAPEPPLVDFVALQAFQKSGDDVDMQHHVTAAIADTSGASTVLFSLGTDATQASTADGHAQTVLIANVPTPDDLACLQVVTLSPSLERSEPTEACPDAEMVEYFPFRRCSTVPASASLVFLLLPLLLRRRRQ
ncbi:MAG: hypothetical protein ACI9MC_001956 [Kiritimatiellia bacterium]|jgi:hypothetical protein